MVGASDIESRIMLLAASDASFRCLFLSRGVSDSGHGFVHCGVSSIATFVHLISVDLRGQLSFGMSGKHNVQRHLRIVRHFELDGQCGGNQIRGNPWFILQ